MKYARTSVRPQIERNGETRTIRGVEALRCDDGAVENAVMRGHLRIDPRHGAERCILIGPIVPV